MEQTLRIIILIIVITILCIWYALSMDFEDYAFVLSPLQVDLTNLHSSAQNGLYLHLQTKIEIIPEINKSISSTEDHHKARDTLIVYGGDSAAGFATNYYTYPINFILYAQSMNMELYLQYNDRYNNKYYDRVLGENSFNYFFDPIQPKSDHTSNVLSYKDLPFIHHISNDSIHAWYYDDFTQKTFNKSLYNATWYQHNRVRASQIVDKHVHPKQVIINESIHIWNTLLGETQRDKIIVLGVQMRGTDKGGFGRKKQEPHLYMPYIINFVKYYIDKGMVPKVFIATDDRNYLRYVSTYWHHAHYLDEDTEAYNYSNVVIMQQNVIRSKFRKAVFSIKDVSKYESVPRLSLRPHIGIILNCIIIPCIWNMFIIGKYPCGMTVINIKNGHYMIVLFMRNLKHVMWIRLAMR
eukprot:569816_1